MPPRDIPTLIPASHVYHRREDEVMHLPNTHDQNMHQQRPTTDAVSSGAATAMATNSKISPSVKNGRASRQAIVQSSHNTVEQDGPSYDAIVDAPKHIKKRRRNEQMKQKNNSPQTRPSSDHQGKQATFLFPEITHPPAYAPGGSLDEQKMQNAPFQENHRRYHHAVEEASPQGSVPTYAPGSEQNCSQVDRTKQSSHIPKTVPQEAQVMDMSRIHMSPQPCLLLVKPTRGEVEELSSFSFQWGRNHQAPGIHLRGMGYELTIRYNNFNTIGREKNLESVVQQKLTKSYIPDIEHAVALMADMGFENISTQVTAHVLSFDTLNLCRPGMQFLYFHTRGPFFWDEEPSSEFDHIEHLLTLLNQGDCLVALVRHWKPLLGASDQYWLKTAVTCFQNGPWNSYQEFVDRPTGNLFAHYVLDPSKKLPHQIWMVQSTREESSVRYAQQPVVKAFATNRELEIVQSAAVIYQQMLFNDEINELFGTSAPHLARIRMLTRTYLELEVFLESPSKTAVAKLGAGAQFKVCFTQLSGNDRDEAVTGRIIYAETSPAFILQCRTCRDLRSCLTKDELTTITVMIGPKNFLRQSTLQLKALSKILYVRKHQPNKTEQTKALQRLLRGEGAPFDVAESSAISRMQRRSDNDHSFVAIQAWISENLAGMTSSQQKAFNHIFNSNDFITVIRGHPGVAQSLMIGITGLTFRLLAYKTLMCAPNKSTVVNMLRYVAALHQELLRKMPNVEELIKVIYVPADWPTKLDLKLFGPELFVRNVMQEGSLDGDLFQYGLWAHIVNNLTRLSRDESGGARQADAVYVLYKIQQIADKVELSKNDWFLAANIISIETGSVLSDPNAIIISTSATASRLENIANRHKVPTSSQAPGQDQDDNRKFCVDVCIIDEAGISTEPESYIPLSLRPEYVVLAGVIDADADQFPDTGQNEFLPQLRTSLSERLSGGNRAPVFEL